MHNSLHSQRSARQKLLPFDGIQNQSDDNSMRRSRFTNFRQVVHKQRQNQKMQNQNRLRLLSKINDRSFELLSVRKKMFQIILDKIDEHYSTLKPESVFMFCWNIIVLIDVLANFFEIPVALFLTDHVYEDQFNNAAPLSINIIFLITLILDTFLIRFNLAYYKFGKQITSRIQIFRRYIKFRFWIDFVTTAALFVYIVAGDPNLIYLKIIFYLKIISLLSVDEQILSYLCIHNIAKGFYKLFRIVLLILFITTWVASIYFAIDYHYYKQNGFYRKTGQIWLTNSNAVGNINLITFFPQWYIWYEYAVYWSLQTSSTVGYGNMTPRNPPEVLYCNFIIVVNTVIFAFYINSIWEIIGEIQSSEKRYSDNWVNLKQIIKNQELSYQTSSRLSDYFHQIWVDQQQQQIYQKLDQMLSTQLKIQMNLAAKIKFFNQIPFFNLLCDFNPLSNQFMKKLVFLIQKVNVAADQIIFQQGQNNQNLYYLLRGKILLSVKNFQSFNRITINQNFGVQQFVAQSNHLVTAKAVSFCKIFKLTLSEFKKCLRQYPILYVKYLQQQQQYHCSLRQRIIIYQEAQLTNQQCFNCKQKTHFLSQCKSLNRWRKYLKQPIQALKVYHPGTPTQRMHYSRRSTRFMQKKQRLPFVNKIVQSDKVIKTQGYWFSYNIY